MTEPDRSLARDASRTFVGREEELAWPREALGRAEGDRPSVVLVGGEFLAALDTDGDGADELVVGAIGMAAFTRAAFLFPRRRPAVERERGPHRPGRGD